MTIGELIKNLQKLSGESPNGDATVVSVSLPEIPYSDTEVREVIHEDGVGLIKISPKVNSGGANFLQWEVKDASRVYWSVGVDFLNREESEFDPEYFSSHWKISIASREDSRVFIFTMETQYDTLPTPFSIARALMKEIIELSFSIQETNPQSFSGDASILFGA